MSHCARIMRVARMAAWGGGLLLAWQFAPGCAAIPTAERIQAVEVAVEDARQVDAYRCAPRELAIAEANLEFAQLELSQGNPGRAEEHLSEAELNAKAAMRMQGADCGKWRAKTFARGKLTAKTDDRDGDGVRDRVDLCPDEPEDLDGYVDRDGCPEADNDKDGIADMRDRCPNEPEDKDQFQDEDGCPDVDNDQDGVVDSEDACPLAQGPASSQGCNLQSFQGINLTPQRVELDPPLVFASGSAILDAAQRTMLGEVARLLRELPALKLTIEVHTDSRGDDAANLVLTQRQADAVRAALIERGVEASRLTAKGYGETRPLESNRTSQGRAVNRRVEILRADVAQQ